MGAEAYTGARVVRCRDAELKPGAGCPHDGCRGKLYDTKQSAIFIRLTGQPLVGATRFEQEVLRCSDCFKRYVADLPEGVKEDEKFDVTADVAIVSLRRVVVIWLVGCKRWLGAANSTPAPFPRFCTPSSNCDRSSVRPGVSRHLQPASICLSPQERVDKTPYQ